MRSIGGVKGILAVTFLAAAFFITRLGLSGALIHASVTGRVWGNIYRYHGRIVRFTVRDDGWPNALHDIVIRDTHIYPQGKSGEHLSSNVLRQGEHVRAEGGVTTFGNRIVADRIIMLHSARRR